MRFKGSIFDVSVPCPGAAGWEGRAALALSEPDHSGDFEALFVSPEEGGSPGGIRLGADALQGGALPFAGVLHPEKRHQVARERVIQKLCSVSSDFLERVLRRQAIAAAVRHFEVMHRREETFVPGSRIPYGGRVFDEREVAALVDSSLDFWLTTGRYARKFEEGLARFLGVEHCSLANSGSSANLLAFMALTSPKLGSRRIARGDEVITVAAGFPTTVAPIVQYGAVPVFLDLTLPTYNVDCAQLENALSERTRGVMLAHTLGNPFDIAAVRAFCRRHDLWLVEDNCDSLGSRYLLPDAARPGGGEYRYTGSFGDLATSSFYPPHHMTMGEGGAVYTDNPQLRRLVESFRDWGRDCWCPSGRDNSCDRRFGQQFGALPPGYDHKYVYSHFGYNLKVTEMQAAIGCAQLEKLPAFIEARKRNWRLLRQGLSQLSDRLILPEPTANADPSWFGFPLTVCEGKGLTRDALVRHLEERGIQTRMLFAGNLTRHPCFDEMRRSGEGYRVVGGLANTDLITRSTFWVGVYPGMSQEMLSFMVESIVGFCR